jgi:proteasome lid subunit RPN8/RPN11
MPEDKDYGKEDFEIEIVNTGKKNNFETGLPGNKIMIGKIGKDDIKIYIEDIVYNQIEKFARTDTTKELGGVLVGRLVQKKRENALIINGALEAKYTDATSSSLKFTHKSWEVIHQEKEIAFPDEKIVGWFHTHPSFGIFLSSYDMFIQNNFFNLPWQVAYVVDPISKIRGFFQWKQDKVEKCSGYYIYGGNHQPVVNETKDSEGGLAEAAVLEYRKQTASGILSRFGVVFGVVNLTLMIVLFIFSWYQFTLLNAYHRSLAAIEKEKRQIEDDLTIIQGKYHHIDQKVTKTEADTAVAVQWAAENSSQISKIEKRLSRLEGRRQVYQVQKGDTLREISRKFYHDPEKYRLIMKLNDIQDQNSIKEGDTLIIE